MASSSSSDIHNIADADDFYFSALYDEDAIFPISDEKYAEQLQLQEALMSSASQTNASSSSEEDASSSSLQISEKDASSSSLQISEKDASSSSLQISSLQISVKDASSSSLQISEKDASSSSSIAATSSPSSLKRMQPMETSEEAQLLDSFCGVCMDTKAPSEIFANATVCGHLFCSDCIRTHVSVKIKENIVEVKCPDPKCKGVIGPELCGSIVPKEVLERWEDALCESLILGAQKFYCPFKDCSAMLVDDGGEAVTSSECPNCNRLFCAQCKVAWHSGMNCSEFKNLEKDERNPEDIMLMELAKNKNWRRCPSCNFFVEKLDGCNHISCRCGYQFCYGCGEYNNGSHACNPSDIAV